MAERRHVALVFPGQGCQFVGMGAELCAQYPEAREVYEAADDAVGYLLSKLCFEGPEDELSDTANAQPAIVATSLALWAVLKPRLNGTNEDIVFAAGHSLGEYSALAAAGGLTPFETIRLVRRRGQAMRQAGIEHPGGMAAIVGLSDEQVRQVAAQASGEDGACWAANYNSPKQVVIAGAWPALERAMALAKACGAKLTTPLAVSVACHTAYMQSAAEAFGAVLCSAPLQHLEVPLVSNVTAAAVSEPDEIRAALLRQLTSPVRWVESVCYLQDQGVTQTIEVGPKAVVSGLVSRISKAIKTTEVTDPSAIAALANGAGS